LLFGSLKPVLSDPDFAALADGPGVPVKFSGGWAAGGAESFSTEFEDGAP